MRASGRVWHESVRDAYGMIALLTGRLAQVEADRCVIDVAGVGYLVQASTRTLAALPRPPEPARVLVETVVREDAILLYGFSDSAERDWFRLLTTVQGVGAKVALGILSGLSPRDLIAVIASGDRSSLTRLQGVGPRLADRLLSELREKAGGMPTGTGATLGTGAWRRHRVGCAGGSPRPRLPAARRRHRR